MRFLLVFCGVLVLTLGKKAPEGKKPEWSKKDIRDYRLDNLTTGIQ
jgi:hypothetical protein